MSIATAITAAQGRVANAYTAISAKGGTLPQTQNLANMPAAINSIPSGGGGNIPNYQIVNGVLSKKTSTYNLTGSEFSGATSIGNFGLYFAFYRCIGLTGSLDLSSVTSIGNFGLHSAFYNCTGVTNADLSSVTSIGNNGMQNAFYGCTGLTGGVDLSSVTSIRDYGLYSAFNDCTGIKSVDLSSVTSIGMSGMDSAFYGCTGIINVNLSSVTSIGSSGMSSAFQRCTGLTDLYFNSLTSSSFGSSTTQFNNMLNGVTGCKVHFPSNLQSVIGSWASVTNGFGGTNTTVLFDLPATE